MATALADFSDTRRFLWALCLRMSGNPADADELVQETYARGLGANQTSRPYLTRIAINLSRDLLRKRKRRGYPGPWLPGVIDTGEEVSTPDVASDRYDLLESVSFAFLLALEGLTAAQRAVLLLVDVFDYSAQEVGEVLGVSEGNVRVIHHRARKAMESYDEKRVVPTAEAQAKTKAALEKFLTMLLEQDVKGIEQLLATDVRSLSDGGGKYRAARVPLIGPERVALFWRRLMDLREDIIGTEFRTLNGMPAFVARFAPHDPMHAPVAHIQVDIGPDGRIRDVYSQTSPDKLTGLESRTSPGRA